MKKNDKLIHVELLESGQHYYFGSIVAIYTVLTSAQIGASAQVLYRHGLEPGNPYTNAKCIIRKGEVHRKFANRKPPVKILRVMG